MTSIIIWLSVEGPGPESRSNDREAAFSPCFTGVLGGKLAEGDQGVLTPVYIAHEDRGLVY